MIRDKLIKVTGKGVKPNFILHGGEEIIIDIPDEPGFDIEPENIPLDIKYEDDYLIVVNKPPGMVTHPARGHHSGTLVNAILAYTSKISPIGGEHRPGIVHRLDKDTSGLLVIAKTETAHLGLASAIAERKVKRQYRAIIWGHPAMHYGSIDAPISYNPKDHTKMAVVNNGKSALTYYTCKAYYDFLTNVEVRLQTGRTHQIRVHFNHIGHSVFGDFDYGGRQVRIGGVAPEYRILANELLAITDRQMLHAERLEFTHPITGEEIKVKSELPHDFYRVIKKCEDFMG